MNFRLEPENGFFENNRIGRFLISPKIGVEQL